MHRRTRIALTACVAVIGGALSPGASAVAPTTDDPMPVARQTRLAGSLDGTTVVLDPGHQLGNANHPKQINKPVPAGGFTKPCNTTGTSTNNGYPEATFVFKFARALERRLTARGAKVVMSRHRNSTKLWGPCVSVRGKLGNKGFRDRKRPADLKVSIHADGSSAGDRGFHLIMTKKQGPSARLARDSRAALGRAGFRRSTYVGSGTALSVRGDLATLNLSKIPAVMVELGNMRNAKDAKTMRREKGQTRYAVALLRGIQRWVG